eukprot:TRINITY_DN42301_c0_g1_i1.p1 TRINITY_DN42301_c0_g1~~TRINITY_DN42301_c0_g1_i1.p1  ORF type:complete len:385 (+),score=57.68 TRINITY_DN42301_c0_g1_i1:121-1275(+)
MLPYHPGQGLSAAAIERLRSRKQAASRDNTLPEEDKSRQSESLLGGGAKKKVRCGICTRPLTDEDDAKGHLVCALCDESAQPTQNNSHFVRRYASACPTPSTEVETEDGRSAPASPDGPTPQLAGPLQVEAADVVSAAVKKGLEGSWEGSCGEVYWVCPVDETSWKCVLGADDSASPQTFWLYFDATENVIWWEETKTHFVCVADIVREPNSVTWQPAISASARGGTFVWYRPDPAEDDDEGTCVGVNRNAEAFPAPQHLSARARPGRGCGLVWTPKLQTCNLSKRQPSFVAKMERDKRGLEEISEEEDYVANTAISEVREQLLDQSQEGFVWIDRWNERFSRHLGTLRDFLESQPDKFIVIPGKGRGYRVALAEGTQKFQKRT